MPDSIFANSIMGRKIDFPEYFPNEQDVIVCFVRINAFLPKIDVNDNKQYIASIRCYFRPPDHVVSMECKAMNFRCQCTQQKLQSICAVLTFVSKTSMQRPLLL